MKKIIVLTTLLIISVVSFSQPTETSPVLNRQYYLEKSKEQKVFAFIFLGVTAVTIPIACTGKVSFGTAGALAVTGILTATGSIMSFISSAKNKRRARNATASFEIKTSPQILNRSFVYKSYPALSLKIKL